MTVGERQFLQEVLEKLPDKNTRCREAVENAIVMFFAILLGLLLVWLFISWVVNAVFATNIGFKSDFVLPVVGMLMLVSFIFSVKSTLKWMKSWVNLKPKIVEDLKSNQTQEQNLTIIDAKRFEEPEHGGLIYFLKVKGKLDSYVIYDNESQNLGAQGKEPFDSKFRVKRHLKIVTAPISQWIIESRFSGQEITIDETAEIWIHPKNWAEPDSWCNIPWDELERHFYGKSYSREASTKK